MSENISTELTSPDKGYAVSFLERKNQIQEEVDYLKNQLNLLSKIMTSPNKISSREDCIALMDTIKAKIVELKNTSDNLHSNWSKEDEKQSIH